MGDFGIPVEDVDKYQKWTGYLLIDIKIVFIFTYVYITVVNLIATTANNEASQDVENHVQFNLTARPEHSDVFVNSIDDSILWSCRKHSLTSDYYVTLYCMLLFVFTVTLVFYAVTKFFALWSISSYDSLSDLWHMGVMKHLTKQMERPRATYSSYCATRLAKCYRALLSKQIPENIHEELKNRSAKVKIRNSLPCLSLVMLILVLVCGALSYDLHPLSCINGIPEESINYDNATQTVELKFPDGVIIYQRVGVFVTFILLIALMIIGLLFYWVTSKIVDEMEKKVEDEIKIMTSEIVDEMEKKVEDEIKIKETTV